MLKNFGRNLTFQPTSLHTPRTEEDILTILQRYPQARIRVVGRLHSWSEAPVGDDIVLDLRHLNSVRTEHRPEGVWATVGAGCQIKRVLSELERQAGVTTPTLGLITEQALAGAISTGTHGSGRQCLSAYISEIRLATYDPATNEPVIKTINAGPELAAARCSLGSLGVIVSLGFWCRPMYRLEEHFRRYAGLGEVLAAESTYPIQQFYLVPWAWTWFAQHRRETDAPRSRLAWLYRLYCYCQLDVAMHLAIIALVRWSRSPTLTRSFFRHILPRTVIQGWRVVDRAPAHLIMEHELFRHIEIEIFVRRSQLADAVTFFQQVLQLASGEANSLDPAVRSRLADQGLLPQVEACAGQYTAHYPICIRKVLADDTMLSMASGDEEDSYSISLISYDHPDRRTGFQRVAEVLSTTMAALFEGRPHWGKVCPLSVAEAARLYPRLPEFAAVCRQVDPRGRFLNNWVAATLLPTAAEPAE